MWMAAMRGSKVQLTFCNSAEKLYVSEALNDCIRKTSFAIDKDPSKRSSTGFILKRN
jgi:hypothetical protein